MELLSTKEMDKLSHLWEFHRTDCNNSKDVRIEMFKLANRCEDIQKEQHENHQ